MPLAAGTRLGPFEIAGALGAGGMGEVYRARDPKLGRDVAVKILPAAVAADPERLARFRREARVLASLNHPHIGAIYGFEDTSGVHALILELVDGETLADRIAAGPLAVAEALAVARQIAAALDAAHESGIVHRDLKPGNIKVRRDGTVKILDFGLAKALSDRDEDTPSDQASTVTSIASRSGLMIGTPAYMSPEQARGQVVDKRTDVWAFGCVLYEMLSGRRPFDGSTVSDTIVSVLSKDPDWTRIPSATPPAVRRLIARCLERHPKRRLRDVGDALPELDAISSSEALPAAVRRSPWLPWAVAGAAVVAAVALAVTNRQESSSSGVASGRLERLTYDAGLTTTPAISADGNFVAYASDRAGREDSDIWVQRSAGGEPLRLTDDAADDRAPEFSPDGSQILFRSERGGGGAYIAPALGGPARLLVAGARDPRFSPDGTRVLYWSGQFRGGAAVTNSAAFVVPLAGGAPAPLLPDFYSARYPMWSPDGEAALILGRQRDAAVSELDWWWVPLRGGAPLKTGIFDRLGMDAASTRGVWTLQGTIFASRGDLWRVQIADDGRVNGGAERLTFGTGNAQMPAASRDGTIVFAAVDVERAVLRAPVGSDAAPTLLYADDRPLARRASSTEDGSRIVIERWYAGHSEIWLKNVQTGEQRLLTRVEYTGIVNATVSAGGERVVYTVHGDSQAGTGYVVDVSAGTARKVCDKCNLWGGFLSDNRRSMSVNGGVIEVIDTKDGSRAELLRAPGNFSRPHVSPDDRWIAFRKEDGIGAKSFVAPVRPGQPPAPETWQQVDEPTLTGRPTGWSLDSRTLYLLLDSDGFRCLWAQPIDPATGRLIGKPFVARHFHDTGLGVSTSAGNAITREGFVYERQNLTGNVWRLLAPTVRQP